MYTNSHRSSIKIYNSKFRENDGVLIFGGNCNILITHTVFIKNSNSAHFTHAFYVTSNIIFSVVFSYALVINTGGMTSNINQCQFINNAALILRAWDTSDVCLSHNEFVGNNEILLTSGGMFTSIEHSTFINNTGLINLGVENMSVSVSHSTFVGNIGNVMYAVHGMVASIDYSKFINNIGSQNILTIFNTSIASITHSEFANNMINMMPFFNNQPPNVIILDGIMTTIRLNEFVNNIAGAYGSLIDILYYTTAENLTNNVFTDNSAEYDVFIHSDCRPGLIVILWAVLAAFNALKTGIKI